MQAQTCAIHEGVGPGSGENRLSALFLSDSGNVEFLSVMRRIGEEDYTAEEAAPFTPPTTIKAVKRTLPEGEPGETGSSSDNP